MCRNAVSSCCTPGRSGFVGEPLCWRKQQGYTPPVCNSRRRLGPAGWWLQSRSPGTGKAARDDTAKRRTARARNVEDYTLYGRVVVPAAARSGFEGSGSSWRLRRVVQTGTAPPLRWTPWAAEAGGSDSPAIAVGRGRRAPHRRLGRSSVGDQEGWPQGIGRAGRGRIGAAGLERTWWRRFCGFVGGAGSEGRRRRTEPPIRWRRSLLNSVLGALQRGGSLGGLTEAKQHRQLEGLGAQAAGQSLHPGPAGGASQKDGRPADDGPPLTERYRERRRPATDDGGRRSWRGVEKRRVSARAGPLGKRRLGDSMLMARDKGSRQVEDGVAEELARRRGLARGRGLKALPAAEGSVKVWVEVWVGRVCAN